MKKAVINAISAAMMISIASYCNLISGNKYVGAVLFAFGLIAVCRYSMSLFTGMAGYIVKKNALEFAVVTAVNCVFAFGFGVLGSFNPAVKEKAVEVCAAKLSNNLLWLFVSAIFCGILIYLGVDIFKKHGTYIGIIFSIPVFVLCGFDHTVADLFYYGAAGNYNAADLLVLPVLIAGNIVGSSIIRGLIFAGKRE